MKEQKHSAYKPYEKEKLEIENDIFANAPQRRNRPEFFMPDGTEVLKLNDFLEIDIINRKSQEKRNRNTLYLMTFIWNVVILCVLVGMIVGGIGFTALFLGAHALVGLVFFYKTLQSIFNKTKIVVDEEFLSIESGPFTLGRAKKQYAAREIKQLYVSKYFTGTVVNGEKLQAYTLHLILHNKKTIRLFEKADLNTALYLEQEIERFLHIEDQIVPSEILE